MAPIEARRLTVSANSTVVARAKRDPAFVRELLAEAARLQVEGESVAAARILADVNSSAARKE